MINRFKYEPLSILISFPTFISFDQQLLIVIAVHDSHPETVDWFKLRLWFRSNRFMEIKQIKAYNFQTLVGNGGGYIGLFLGYSFVQLPSMIISGYCRLKKMILSKNHL